MPLNGIRTHTFSRRAAAELRFRQHGHWDRRAYMGTASFPGLKGPKRDVNHPPTLERGQRKSIAMPLLPRCVLMTGCRVNCTLYWFGLLVARKEAETCSVD